MGERKKKKNERVLCAANDRIVECWLLGLTGTSTGDRLALFGWARGVLATGLGRRLILTKTLKRGSFYIFLVCFIKLPFDCCFVKVSVVEEGNMKSFGFIFAKIILSNESFFSDKLHVNEMLEILHAAGSSFEDCGIIGYKVVPFSISDSCCSSKPEVSVYRTNI